MSAKPLSNKQFHRLKLLGFICFLPLIQLVRLVGILFREPKKFVKHLVSSENYKIIIPFGFAWMASSQWGWPLWLLVFIECHFYEYFLYEPDLNSNFEKVYQLLIDDDLQTRLLPESVRSELKQNIKSRNVGNDFGTSINNPIRVNRELGAITYISMLRTPDGKGLIGHRIFCIGDIDIYELTTTDLSFWLILFFDVNWDSKDNATPTGLIFDLPEGPALSATVKTVPEFPANFWNILIEETYAFIGFAAVRLSIKKDLSQGPVNKPKAHINTLNRIWNQVNKSKKGPDTLDDSTRALLWESYQEFNKLPKNFLERKKIKKLIKSTNDQLYAGSFLKRINKIFEEGGSEALEKEGIKRLKIFEMPTSVLFEIVPDMNEQKLNQIKLEYELLIWFSNQHSNPEELENQLEENLASSGLTSKQIQKMKDASEKQAMQKRFERMYKANTQEELLELLKDEIDDLDD